MFKGELSLDDIMWKLPKKRLYELMETRKQVLIKEQEELERLRGEEQRASIRNSILAT